MFKRMTGGDFSRPVPRIPGPKDIRRHIAYESELDPDFGEKIARKAYGEKLFSCIQCGTCSGTCPVPPRCGPNSSWCPRAWRSPIPSSVGW